MNLLEDIPELIKANVISEETAEKIKEYYKSKGSQSQQKIVIVFSVLGAILVGLGIILIIAHNWDNFSTSLKTVLAFLPLLIGQILCGYTLYKKSSNIAWKESCSAFLFFGVGASISLISQIYNLSGELSSFLLLWLFLCLPIIYIMQSSVASLLYITLSTYYLGEACYWHYPNSESYYYWLLLLLILPHYYHLYKHKAHSNFTTFHHWLIPLSIVFSLGSIANHHDRFMYLPYATLFGLFYIIGNSHYFKTKKSSNNGYFILGSLGTSYILISLSFDDYWERLRNNSYVFSEVMSSPEMISALLLFIISAISFWKHKQHVAHKEFNLSSIVFILFPFIFLIGLYTKIPTVLINLLIMAIGILNIRKGAKTDHLGILNYGLLMISTLVICRFFDTDMSYVIRGILFVSVGIGFFLANFLMLKKRKENGK